MLTVDKINEADLFALSGLFEELSGLKTNLALMRQNFAWMEKNPDYYVLGAKYNGILAGTLMGIICKDLVGECKPFMVIENVIVSGNYRSLGIGKQLMTEIERIGKERNCYYVMFVSGSQRKDAHRFYSSLGYHLDEVQGFKKYLRKC